MKQIHIWLTLIILVICEIGLAQQPITGMVIEETAEGAFNPIPYANVFWLGTQIGTATDTSGYFEIVPSSETSKLVISYVGYKGDTVEVEQKDKLTIILKNKRMLDEVEVVYRTKGTEISYMNPIKTENIGVKELYKAACCNLSESFETNPSVDVAYTDAVTGTKQIQMLGLDGKYSQITREAMPSIRGLSTVQGLTYIPGTWIQSIQLNKGAGSVVNGFESVTGQINVELKKADQMDPWFVNAYANQGGRTELNVDVAKRLNDKLSTSLMLHGNLRPIDVDGNGDGFLDFPTGHQVNAVNRWRFSNNKGWEAQLNGQAVIEEREGGQIGDVVTPYRIGWNTEHYEVWAKTGYSFKEKKYKSIGFQGSYIYHDQTSNFGIVNYLSNQESGYFNSIFQSIIGSTTHKYRTGLSLQYDRFSESMLGYLFQREEIVPGAYFEYTLSVFEKFSMVAGIRGDYHNQFGAFATPRLHLRYELKEGLVLRASGGRGQRTANVIAENVSYLASNRGWYIEDKDGNLLPHPSSTYGFGIVPEVAWNGGANLTYDFRIDYKPATLAIDFYHTEFIDQTVVDLEDPYRIQFYNLDGRSYATSLQTQFDYELTRKVDVRVAYRWYDVMTTYRGELKRKPFTSKHRAFANVGYEFGKDWKWDATVHWQDPKRIPNLVTRSNPDRVGTNSPDVILLNTQISKTFAEVLDVYIGMENITNVRQPNPIVSSDNPFSDSFDSSMIWGPVFGRMTYVGIRLGPKKKA